MSCIGSAVAALGSSARSGKADVWSALVSTSSAEHQPDVRSRRARPRFQRALLKAWPPRRRLSGLGESSGDPVEIECSAGGIFAGAISPGHSNRRKLREQTDLRRIEAALAQRCVWRERQAAPEPLCRTGRQKTHELTVVHDFPQICRWVTSTVAVQIRIGCR